MFTKQELIYLALGMRTLAKESLEEARTTQWQSTKDIYRRSAETYEALARKCEQLGGEITSPPKPRRAPGA